jgi:rRNA-processing protein FCF1
MRHGRAKAARKTLRYFERTVNLKSKPYYSVLLDATFLIAMVRITSNNGAEGSGSSNNNASESESTIVSRIERVLQVNGGGSSISGYERDHRLSGVVGGYDRRNDQEQNFNSQPRNNNHMGSGRYNVRYYVPQEAIDEIEMILKSFRERSEQTKKRKKQKQYEEKSKVFDDALAWIKKHCSKRQNYKGNARCEVLPRLEAVVEPPTKKKKTQQEPSETEPNPEQPPIGASDAVRRHIARDDGREDSETNQIISKKQKQQNASFTRTYIVASQEEGLLDDLRMLGTVPILRCANNASVLILEHPSKKGQSSDKGKERAKWKGTLQNPAEKALVDAAWEVQKKEKVKITGVSDANKRGQNKAKGPNPLSFKRKRKDSAPQQQASGGGSKSKKRRARAQRNKERAESSATAGAGPRKE